MCLSILYRGIYNFNRPKVVAMWKSRGLNVIDCGTGEDF